MLRRTIELKENTTIIVLGASGDLAKKKTVSLVQNAANDLLIQDR